MILNGNLISALQTYTIKKGAFLSENNYLNLKEIIL